MLIASSLLLIYTHAYILLNKDNEENVSEDLCIKSNLTYHECHEKLVIERWERHFDN